MYQDWRFHSFRLISGGNQRDLARAKAQKKIIEAKKGARTDNLTVEQRKARWVQRPQVHANSNHCY